MFYTVLIVGTGNPIENDIQEMKFVGTVQRGSGVHHVFIHPSPGV
jgi:hypothetical protein